MDNQEFRNAYRAARIKHEDAHHTFPFDNCYMPECETAWEQMNMSNDNIITNPTEQLEALAAHQQEFESLLQARTGLTVKVTLGVHSADNSVTDLLNLFEASLTLPDFEPKSTPKRTWISYKDISRSISVFMPDGFDTADLYPEPEDDEGYAQALENADVNKAYEDERSERSLYDDEIPF